MTEKFSKMRRVAYVVDRRNFRDGGPRKRTFACQMICSFADITGNGSGTIANQMAGFFAVKANNAMTGIGEMEAE